MKKGTILYVGNFELPDKGASANRVVSNGKLFQKMGYTVAYMGVNKAEHFEGVRVMDEINHMYEEVYPRGSKEWFLHMYSTKNIQFIQKRYPDLCMVILYNVPFLLLKRVKALYKNTKIKVVYDCTEWTGVTEGSLPKRIIKRLDEYFIRTRIGNVADGLIVISKMMQEQYKNCKKMILLPPLVDIHDSIWHQEMKREDERFEFCFAGMLDGNKESLDKIVEAFSEIKNTNSILRIIGVTEAEFCTHYPEMVQTLEGIKLRIIFMGRLSHRETIKYVLHCDNYIFVRQSDRRNNAGFPTKFAESYSCGCSIITTDISDIRYYLQNGKRGKMLRTTSVKEIKEAMQEVMQEDRKLEKEKLDETFHYETYLNQGMAWMEQIDK